MPLHEAEDELCRQDAGRLIELELRQEAAGNVRTPAIGALPLAVAQLIVDDRWIIAVRGHHDGKFRLDKQVPRSADLVADAEAELRRAFVQRAKPQAESGGFKQVGQS